MNKIVKWWEDFFQSDEDNWWAQKKKLTEKRAATIVQLKGRGHIFQQLVYDHKIEYRYLLHLSFLINQEEYLYEEEMVIPYLLQIENDKIIKHKEIIQKPDADFMIGSHPKMERRESRETFSYDRLEAVKYAEYWWNSYNPAYEMFAVDCTNYVSQCLRAGGAPMRGQPNDSEGWWYENNKWSFSWAVAHSLRWYLSGSGEGLQGKEVATASELYPGDVICYDFQGDGRWDHTTIVVAKDAQGMPLVNAHTDNSRHRYWSYEDSTAWTSDIRYKFFQVSV